MINLNVKIIKLKNRLIMEIKWQDHIHSDPEILSGKPVVKGTRLSVEFLMGLFEAGWSEKQILENYPRLTKEKLRAVFTFTRECLEMDYWYPNKESV